MDLLKKIFILLGLISILNGEGELNYSNINKNEISLLDGIYFIKSFSNNLYLSEQNNIIILSNNIKQFKITQVKQNSYFIIYKLSDKKIGLDNYGKITIFDKNEKKNLTKMIWTFTKIKDNQFLIQNKFNQNYLITNNNSLQFSNDVSYIENNKIIDNIFVFSFLKLYSEKGELKKEYLEILEKEPIDVLIKYIDLSDKTLNRTGIKQIYKDQDNEELKYSVRSILKYIPWIRKIFILMPNKRVKYFKSVEEIKEKIIYIDDKKILGFDSANIFAFSFNLYKMEKFGISKNFIYMEDDFFIGQSLNKSDFFYYDEKKKKVLPYLLTCYFNEMNRTETLRNYYNLLKIKDSIHPHSNNGWFLSIYSTDKYFIERYNMTIINTQFTHNAIAENIDDLKEVFEEIKSYEFINETLFSKERHILTLNQPHFVNLYQLNIKHKRIHSIPYNYVIMENIKKYNLNEPLFVINTGGNHIPTKRQYKIQKKIMEGRFPFQTQYEITDDIKKKNKNLDNFISYLFLIFDIIKIVHTLKIYKLNLNIILH